MNQLANPKTAWRDPTACTRKIYSSVTKYSTTCSSSWWRCGNIWWGIIRFSRTRGIFAEQNLEAKKEDLIQFPQKW